MWWHTWHPYRTSRMVWFQLRKFLVGTNWGPTVITEMRNGSGNCCWHRCDVKSSHLKHILHVSHRNHNHNAAVEESQGRKLGKLVQLICNRLILGRQRRLLLPMSRALAPRIDIPVSHWSNMAPHHQSKAYWLRKTSNKNLTCPETEIRGAVKEQKPALSARKS